MPVHNTEIADIFDRLADLLDIEGENAYRVRAYRNAARVVRDHSQSMVHLLEEGKDLSELPSIGEDLADKIKTIVETGTLPLLEEVEERHPESLSELMKLPGLGPKRIKTLHHELEIDTPKDLEKAAKQGKLRELEGFGEKTEEKIKEAIKSRRDEERRVRLADAQEIAESLLEYLKETKGVKDIEIAGSYRRRKETVGDLDILITCKKGSPVMDHFVDYGEVAEVVSKGKTRSTIRLRSGLQVDLRVVPQVCYGAALHYFTGSKAHNIAVRKLGVKRDLKINEYGVFKDEDRIAGKTEKEVFEQVGLSYIEPELREDRGEIEAAKQDRLPQLVTLGDIRGDLHMHTKATDGNYSLEEMVRSAQDRGYEYIAVTDHSKRVTMAKGLDAKRLREQIEEADRLNDKIDGITVLKGIEVDILEDGSLDLPDDVLKELDLTVCSVHYNRNLSRKKQTERIIRAMDNPSFKILGHPTGRLINEREPYDVNIERILEAAKERGCFVELDAQPSRLDLSDTYCKLAKEIGVKVAISTDAHGLSDLDNMRFGIYQARRGWLEADDVLNSRRLKDLQKLLKRD